MEFLTVVLKILFILATVLLMAVPILLELLTFHTDKEKKISYKRFRQVIYTLIYVIAITVALCLLRDALSWLGSNRILMWIARALGVTNRLLYFLEVLVAIVVNLAVGIVYWLLSKLVRIGIKKKDLTKGKKKNGDFTWAQKWERGVIKFFYTETWFYVGNILKWLSITLSAVYALVFIAYQIPAVFGAEWVPYSFISTLFGAGYIYPLITLLALWEAYFFLAGIQRLEEECPELLYEQEENQSQQVVDLAKIDEEVRKQFKDYYVKDVDLSAALMEEISSTDHHEITTFIGQAVERDKRNPQQTKEAYLNCLDKLIGSDASVLINGTFFSEFSMYFLRYISTVIARGDNVVFVCNTDAQIDEVYEYIKTGLTEISSLYSKGFRRDAVNFDDPIWRVVKINGEADVIDEASIDDNSILVTSLSYLCSTHFESEHRNFIHLLDTVVFVDTLKTVNTYNRQLTMLNTRLKHIIRNNALLSRNGNVNTAFGVRYMSKQVRYVCFDDTRTPGLDKVLKNKLAVDFESADAMHSNPQTIVRCYNYEGRLDENGRRSCPQFVSSEEEIGAMMNMAVMCLAMGASNVTVMAEDSIPYANIAETIAANRGKVSIKADGSNLRLNKPFYNPDEYSVLIVMDSGDNLPATVRKAVSMVSDKPTLVLVFSRPYMMRDYYLDRIESVWDNTQIERIPVEENTKKDIAQRILVKANAGGISEAEILKLWGAVADYDPQKSKTDVNAILREVLELYALTPEESVDLFQYFEYASSRDFDENGVYCPEDKVLLRRQGKLFDMINGRDMVILCVGDKEIVLPLPKSRLTQNYIVGQNLLYNGNIYHINKIDTATGKVYARLAVGGKNDEAYEYIQAREYNVDLSAEQPEMVFPMKHVVLDREEEDIAIKDVYVSVFRAPMEVVTKGYFEVDPHTRAFNTKGNKYHCISDAGNDILAKQTYRRYGSLTNPAYSSDSIYECTNLVASRKGALMMSVRICGQFGADVDKVMSLAATMLNEQIRSMFPSVADAVAVCPVLHNVPADDESKAIMRKMPHLEVKGQSNLISTTDFNLVIVEDCPTDLGVVSVLMSAGDDVLNTLFNPILNYLQWYLAAETKSEYLYFGLDHEPSCFDFASLHKLSKLLGDDKHDLKFVDLESVMEYAVCDFCGKRYAKGDDVIVLDDGRQMCRTCAENLVGNNKKILKAHLERAKIFLESTYGITLDDDYEFCFESTVKIANRLKQNRDLQTRGADVPLKAYVDDKKKVHVEYSLPSVNLSELLVRELTYVWQLRHLPDLAEDLAEGHIALVGIQYLRFLNQESLATVRTTYYECNSTSSGEGYRKLIQQLLANPQYNNNPFRYLLDASGVSTEDVITPPTPHAVEEGAFGLTYTPEQPDRILDGPVPYFFYNRLPANCQQAYDAFVDAINCHQQALVITNCTFQELEKVADAVRFDHPELFWFKTFAMGGTDVTMYYGASADESAALQTQMDAVVAKYLEGIDDSMSAYDVALHLHAKLIASVDYDTIALEKQQREGGPSMEKIDYLRTICGVFLEGKAVCEGYARAIQYLLQKCGVECAELGGHIRKETGEFDGGHAWNLVKIDGDYYHLDATWDDSSNTVQTVKTNDLGFDYFCITTDEVTRTRDVDMCPVTIPKCEATRANYFVHNDLVLDTYDLAKIKTIARNAAKNQCSSFVIKCKSKTVFEQAMAQLCDAGQDCYDALKDAAKADKKILTDTYSYTYNKQIRTITVRFKYK